MKPGEGIERSAISKRSLKLSELVFRFGERAGARPANLEYLPNLKVAHPQRTDEAGRFVDDRRIFRRIVDFLKVPLARKSRLMSESDATSIKKYIREP